MRRLLLVCALLASGCYRWAPVSSLSSIEDDRILVHEGWGDRTLIHATARGHIIEAQESIGERAVEIDATQSRVLVRRLNVPATVAIITSSAVGLAGTIAAFVLVVAALTRPVFEAGPPK